MKKILGILSGLVLTLAFASSVFAAENWELTAPSGIDLVCGGSTYSHTLNDVTNDPNGSFEGTGTYNPNTGYTWDMAGEIDGDGIEFYILYTGINAGYTLNGIGTIAPDGSISGTTDGNCQTFSMGAGSGVFNRRAEITAPDEDEIVYGDVSFEAYLMDNDYDYVDWAVRKGTCAAGTNTVFGNVDGHSDPYSWALANTYKYEFSAVADTSSWDGGKYCFIFNPREDSGEANIRLTREFYIAEGKVSGGGQIVEEVGSKPKDYYKVSFGGHTWDLGSLGYMGEWEINFHNVDGDEFDKSKFHSTDIAAVNFYDGNNTTCYDAMNMTMYGEWNGTPGYKVILRGGDYGAPGNFEREGMDGSFDTVRVELFNSDSAKVYDTSWPSEFVDESSCVGSSRTGLDNGNITIWN